MKRKNNHKLSLEKIKITKISTNNQKHIIGGQRGSNHSNDGSNTTIMTVFPM